MTMGQRIALKRRELGLSQEGLGERLGVSRQAIYKWESDAALPEIEKLVNLSREFSVSVDWLLGEEDETAEKPELTPEQLRMVEEIVGRYLSALPAAVEPPVGEDTGPETPPKKRRWPYVLASAAAIVVLAVFGSLFSRLDSVDQEYQNLQNSVYNVQNNVDRQIGTITSRVEEVLQSQNALTAEQSALIADTDYRANTVTVEARTVPRTYVEGMTAEFILVSGGKTVTVPGTLGENHAFTARLTGPLTDEITVSAVFLTGEQRQTQVLKQFTFLYSLSLPSVSIHGEVSRASKTEGDAGWTVSFQPVNVYCSWQGDSLKLASLRVGLFQDQRLMQWFTEEKRDGYDGYWRTFRSEQETILLETGHDYCIAAVIEDEFGREWVLVSERASYAAAEDVLYGYGAPLNVQHIPYSDADSDPADWEY